MSLAGNVAMKTQNITKEETQGMLYSNADLRRLILPLIMEQLLAILVGMLDTVMISGVGEAAVSGVSLVDSVNILVINILRRWLRAVPLWRVMPWDKRTKNRRAGRRGRWCFFYFIHLLSRRYCFLARTRLFCGRFSGKWKRRS